MTRPLVKQIATPAGKRTVVDYSIARRPDDAAYRKSHEVWATVPRGKADLCEGDQVLLRLRGLPKFGYRNDADEWCYPGEWRRLWFAGKENGECFHVRAAEPEPGAVVLLMGSKNVHFVVCAETLRDFAERHEALLAELRATVYTGARFGYAFALAAQFGRALLQDGVDCDALQRLVATHTACAEGCDLERTEHLVYYGRPTMRFFALTYDSPSEERSFCVHPREAREAFLRCGLEVPTLESVDAADDEAVGAAERRHEQSANSEGAVVYVEAGDGRICAVYKHKNLEYVVRRATREKIRASASHEALVKRLDKLHVPVSSELRCELLDFRAWVEVERAAGTLRAAELADRYLTVYRRFLEAGAPSRADSAARLEEVTENAPPLHVIVVGAPAQGLGKTRLCFTLAGALEAFGVSAVRVCQDDEKGQRRAFLTKLGAALEDPEVGAVLVDKYNNKSNRKDVVDAVSRVGRRCELTFVGLTAGSRDEALALGLQRVKRRGRCHPSLHATKPNLAHILGSFYDGWTMAEGNEGFNRVLECSATEDTRGQAYKVVEALGIPRAPAADAEPAAPPPPVNADRSVDILSARIRKRFEADCMRRAQSDLLLSQSMAEGLERHAAYEADQDRSLYWSIELHDDASAAVQAACAPHYPGTLQPVGRLHVTLGYRQRGHEADYVRMQRELYGRRLEGKRATFRLVAVSHDERVAAAEVVLVDPLPHERDKRLHVTLALGGGAAKKDAGAMLAAADRHTTEVQFGPVRGRVTRHTM